MDSPGNRKLQPLRARSNGDHARATADIKQTISFDDAREVGKAGPQREW
jgi:hypothetical protein